MRNQLLVMLSILIFQSIAFGNQPAPEDILDRFAATQERLSSFSLKAETHLISSAKHNRRAWAVNGATSDVTILETVRSDGQRHYHLQKRWGRHIDGRMSEAEPRGYNCMLWDGQVNYQYQHPHYDQADGLLFLTRGDLKDFSPQYVAYAGRARYASGYFRESPLRIDKQIREMPSLKFIGMRTVNGSKCCIITANEKDFSCTLFFDTEHDYHLARAKIKRKNIFTHNIRRSLTCDLRNVEFKNVDGHWIPAEADTSFQTIYAEGGYSKETYKYKLLEFELNPNHEAEKSFDNSFIGNGTKVILIGAEKMPRMWINGQVVIDGEEIEKIENARNKKATSLPASKSPEPTSLKQLLELYAKNQNKLATLYCCLQVQTVEGDHYTTQHIALDRSDETFDLIIQCPSHLIQQITCHGSNCEIKKGSADSPTDTTATTINKAQNLLANCQPLAPFTGHFNGQRQRIDKFFSQFPGSVSFTKDTVDKIQCYCVTAKTADTEYRFWFSPRHAYQIITAEIRKDSHLIYQLDSARPKNVQGVQLPVYYVITTGEKTHIVWLKEFDVS